MLSGMSIDGYIGCRGERLKSNFSNFMEIMMFTDETAEMLESIETKLYDIDDMLEQLHLKESKRKMLSVMLTEFFGTLEDETQMASADW